MVDVPYAILHVQSTGTRSESLNPASPPPPAPCLSAPPCRLPPPPRFETALAALRSPSRRSSKHRRQAILCGATTCPRHATHRQETPAAGRLQHVRDIRHLVPPCRALPGREAACAKLPLARRRPGITSVSFITHEAACARLPSVPLPSPLASRHSPRPFPDAAAAQSTTPCPALPVEGGLIDCPVRGRPLPPSTSAPALSSPPLPVAGPSRRVLPPPTRVAMVHALAPLPSLRRRCAYARRFRYPVGCAYPRRLRRKTPLEARRLRPPEAHDAPACAYPETPRGGRASAP